ncbi:vWA domain-containing protein [Actinorugispora endophytica]|uniref:VWFA domain-containing protein n=1 Tax=Actinorugispora endophytica TaxID=1605990 RepID=A0A4R6V5X7_9ACTN|nr:vWA domain-containing protein [Actinorugispora endophytica]TDQ53808.1 hypothetical protein EV190_103259 [Actinorugispora endophytica]
MAAALIGGLVALLIFFSGWLAQEILGRFLPDDFPLLPLVLVFLTVIAVLLLLALLRTADRIPGLRQIRQVLVRFPLSRYAAWGFAVFCVLMLVAAPSAAALNGPCPPPAQLVVATTTDGEEAVRAAADAFEAGRRADVDGGLPRDCRPVDVTVFSVGSAEVLRQALDNDWVAPGSAAPEGDDGPPDDGVYLKDRTLGPRPHYVIPESSVDYLGFLDPGGAGSGGTAGGAPDEEADLDEEAVLEGGGRLRHLGSTRTTPLIWAVPRGFPDDAGVGLLRDDLGVDWARPGLEETSAGRLHGAYQQRLLSDTGGAAGAAAAEARFLTSVSADSSASLLCGLREEAETVALVSEAALHRAQNAEGSGSFSPECPGPVAAELEPRYKSGLPVLDHPLIRVSWEEDEGVAGEQEKFESFMLDLADDPSAYDADGVYAGYRSTRGEGTAADVTAMPVVDEDGVSVAAQIPEWVDDSEPQEWWEWAVKADEARREAGGPATVLVMVDRSTSMASVPEQFAAVRTVTETIVRDLGEEDRFGLWSYPQGETGADAGSAAERVGLDRADAAGDAAAEMIEGLSPAYQPTPLREAVRSGVRALEGEEPGAILVVVTDGVRVQDDAGLGRAELEDVLDDTDARVRIIAVGGGAQQRPGQEACDVGLLPELAGHPNVECRDADQGRADEAARGVVQEARGGN